MDFVKLNPADVSKTIVSETFNFTSLIGVLANTLSECLTFGLFLVLLFSINWKITLLLVMIFFFISVFLNTTVSRKIKKLGENRIRLSSIFHKIVNETFGNFKIIKLIANNNKFLKHFSKCNYKLSRSYAWAFTLQAIPRFLLESSFIVSIVGILTFVVYSVQEYNFIVSYLIFYVLALYRMLPAVSKIITNYDQIMYLSGSVDVVRADLNKRIVLDGNELIAFKDSIDIENISFFYESSSPILLDVTLHFKRGDRIAVLGPSGSGKTTLIGLIMGIISPVSGRILIDRKELSNQNVLSWKKHIGYIPQDVYLFDGTVARNISFGKQFDETRVVNVMKKARIWEYFQSSPQGIFTMVGDNGVRLSGGQKQRIGIARALYSDPEVLFLDEPTSALDQNTEAEIVQEVFELSKGKTLFVVAHRLITISRCNKIIKIDNKKAEVISKESVSIPEIRTTDK